MVFGKNDTLEVTCLKVDLAVEAQCKTLDFHPLKKKKTMTTNQLYAASRAKTSSIPVGTYKVAQQQGKDIYLIISDQTSTETHPFPSQISFNSAQDVSSLLLMLLNTLPNEPQITEQNTQSPESVHRLSPNDQAWIKGLENWIEASLQEGKLSAASLADAAHISPRQLRRKIKALTGHSPLQFIREVQFRVALREMKMGNHSSLADIAFKSGFEHQAYFSTLFKNRFGMTPTAYLKAHTSLAA